LMCGARWINRRDERDQPVLTLDRKPIYNPVIEFRDRASRDRFGDMIIAALRASNPGIVRRGGRAMSRGRAQRVGLALIKELLSFRGGGDADDLKQERAVFADVIIQYLTGVFGGIVFDAQLVGDPLAGPGIIEPGIFFDECEEAAAYVGFVVEPLAALLAGYFDAEASFVAVSPLIVRPKFGVGLA